MKKISFVLAAAVLFAPAFSAQAVMQSLNTQTGQNQTFGNDTNIQITSANNVHSIIWNGVLDPSRGGTGNNNVFNQGSVVFAGNNGIYRQDNNNLFWDNTNNRLGIGTNTPQFALDVSGEASANSIEVANVLNIGFSNLFGTHGVLLSTGTAPEQFTDASYFAIKASDGSGDQAGGHITLATGSAASQTYARAGGDLIVQLGTGDNGGRHGRIYITGGDGAVNLELNGNPGNSLTFPNASGTFSLLESNQTFTGINTFTNPVNNFISTIPSTVYIGKDNIPGCLAMGDTTNGNTYYITITNGVMNVSSTPPSNCQ